MLISLSLADIGTLAGVLAGLFGVSVLYAVFLEWSERSFGFVSAYTWLTVVIGVGFTLIGLAVASLEAEQGQRLAESLVKQITGGDTIAARFLRAEWFDFKPAFKLFLATNHKPVIRGTDNAIWRRIHLIPFEVSIPEAEQDKTLPDKLKAELPGILAWAVRGCMEWQADGLGTPAEVKEATAAYRAEQDVIGGWLEDCCHESATATGRAGELYASYKAWCDENGERAINGRKFAQALEERGFDKFRDTRGNAYIGLGLVAQESNEALPM